MNVAERRGEEDCFAAQVFPGAASWLWRNQDAERIFLVVDSFDPHEPWDPPVYCRRMYDPDDDVVDVIWSTYRTADEFTVRELQRMRGNPRLRWALVMASGHFASSTKTRELSLTARYRHHVYKHGPNPAKVALARRLVDIIFAMLRDKTVFDSERYLTPDVA